MQILEELRQLSDAACLAKVVATVENQQQFVNVVEEIIADLRGHTETGSYDYVVFLKAYDFLMPDVCDHKATLIEAIRTYGIHALPAPNTKTGIYCSWKRGEDR